MKYIVANYKMHCTRRESTALARGVLRAVEGTAHAPYVVLCPSFPSLVDVQKVIAKTPVMLGAQNVASTAGGAMTGEVSALQLKDAGCAYVLVGHSERRQTFGETSDTVREKILQAFAVGVTPILCVGETKAERDEGKAEAVVADQISTAFRDVAIPRSERLIVAYEPVWAIGDGDAATPADVVLMHQHIRRILTPIAGEVEMTLLYGGSVDGQDARSFLCERDIDGVLVGGASITLQEFLLVMQSAAEVMQSQNI